MPEIRISVQPNGQLGVAVSNDIAGTLPIALGFLELAKSALLDQAKQNENKVQPVSMMPPGLLGGN